MTLGTEGPAPMYSAPGPDMAQRTLGEVLEEALSIMSRDGGLDQMEMKAVAAFMAGVQSLAEGQMAQQGPAPGMGQMDPSNEAVPFGEPQDGSAEPAGYEDPNAMSFQG